MITFIWNVQNGQSIVKSGLMVANVGVGWEWLLMLWSSVLGSDEDVLELDNGVPLCGYTKTHYVVAV